MALPKDVHGALEHFDGYMDAVLGEYPGGESAWQTIRAHLMSQEAELAGYKAEMERLNVSWAARSHDVVIAESRLAAANALLSRCFVQIGELTKGLDPHDPIYVELQQLGLDWMQHSEADTADLSENAHG